jgi:hypothetical protein
MYLRPQLALLVGIGQPCARMNRNVKIVGLFVLNIDSWSWMTSYILFFDKLFSRFPCRFSFLAVLHLSVFNHRKIIICCRLSLMQALHLFP